MDIFLNQTTIPLLQLLRETEYPAAPQKICYEIISEEFKEHYTQTWHRVFLLQIHNISNLGGVRILCLLHSSTFQLQYLFIMEIPLNIFWPSNFFISLLKNHLSLE